MAKRHFYLQWDSTDNCNLRCKHCYHGGKDSHIQTRDLMSIDKVYSMIDDLDNTASKWDMRPRIAISGGEPLKRLDLYDILRYTQDKEMITNLLTNGTLLSRRKSKDIKELGINTIQVSIDGIPETHNEIRGREYAFDRAVEGINNASSEKIEVVVSMTATKKNQHEFEEVIQIAYEAGAKRVGFKTYVPSVELGSNDPLYLDSSEIFKLITHTNELTEKYDGKIQILHSDVLFQILEPDNELIDDAKKEDKFLWGCAAGYRSLSVLSDGTVYPCRRLPVSIGNISEGITKLVLDSEVMQDLRDMRKMRENTLCDKVVHCRGCRAISYAVTGDYMAKDPMCFKDFVEIKDG
ncbi:radical SAM protein [Candidatus Pacearchaeota archaeon]|nr:radical SAM protein [Candidatus Pacearchaeota archaeon]